MRSTKAAADGETATALTDLIHTKRSLHLEITTGALILFEILVMFYQMPEPLTAKSFSAQERRIQYIDLMLRLRTFLIPETCCSINAPRQPGSLICAVRSQR